MPDSEADLSNDLTDIYQGILKNDLSLLQKGVNNRANVNLSFKGESNVQHIGMTPLALAAALNKVEVVKFLLDNDANINDTFASLRTTALMTASFHGHSPIVCMLIQRGANVQAIDLQGSTALGYAFGGSRSVEVIKLLLLNGVNINQKNMLGMNALLLVAGYGDDNLVRMVLEAGADPNSINDFGHSALHLVIVGKRSQLKKLAMGSKSGGKVNIDNFNNLKFPEVALKDWAAKHRNLQVENKKLEKAANLMTNIGSKMQRTFLKTPDDNDQEVIKQRVEAVWLYRQEKLLANKKSSKKSGKFESFLTCGGKKNKDENDLSNQPYLAAPSRSSKRMNVEKEIEISELRERFARILTMVVDAGCLVETTEKTFGMTALDMAILLEDVDSTGVLLARGADPEHLLKMFALSDLHEAISSGDKKLVEKLLAYDSDLNIDRPFSLFNVDSKIQDDEDVGSVVICDGMTPLTVAVQMPEDEGHALKIAKVLIKNKADVNRIECGGSSPLMEATRIGNLQMCQLLVSNGADVNQPCPNYNNATPIIIAAIFNRAEVASFLSDNKAKLDFETSDKRCALTEAFRNDNLKIVETVLRGSLGQSFADRTSFTYSMVVKYQRPDKNMNTILKLIGEELKQQDEARKIKDAELKKKLQKSNSFTRQQSELYHNWEKKKNIANNSKNATSNNNLNLNNNNNNKNGNGTSSYSDEDYANINEVKKVSNLKDVQFVKIDKNIIEEPIQKVSSSELNASSFNDLDNMKKTIKNTSSSNINDIAKSNFDGLKPTLSTFKNTLEVNKSQLYKETASKVKNVFDENARKMQEKFSTSISDVGKRLNDDMQKPIQNLINDTSVSFKSALDNVQNEVAISVKPALSNFQPKNQQQYYHQQYYPLQNQQQHYQQQHYPQHQQYLNPQNRYVDDQDDFRSHEEAEYEDWEDETGFQEQYYPASGLENEEPGLMTTPILGRCAQVRSNYAQADLYLRDVVKTGNAPRFNVKSSLSQIRHLDNEEQDE